MATHTDISWTDSTFNPWWGCVKVSDGCKHCYAEGVATRFAGIPIWGPGSQRRTFGNHHWHDPIRWHRKAQKSGIRHRVFCGSMMDVFEDHPTAHEQRPRLWNLIRQTPCLDWQLLTKRPQNIGDMLPDEYFPNVWLGTSVEDNRVANRIDLLREHRDRCPVLFLSAEPLIGQVTADLDGIDWVIIGGESGKGARPMDLRWARSLIQDCRDKDVAAFVKQLGSTWARGHGAADSKGADPGEWSTDLQIQDFPVCEGSAL